MSELSSCEALLELNFSLSSVHTQQHLDCDLLVQLLLFAAEAYALLLPADWHACARFTCVCATCTRGMCLCMSKVTPLTSDMCLCRFKVTLLKANSLPAFATNLNFPLLENDEEWIVQGYTYVSHRLAQGTCMAL